MLYPAELRARTGSITRVRQTGLPRRFSEAGISSAVLTAVSSCALVAGIGRGAIVVSEGAGKHSGPVIVGVAYQVGQAVVADMMMVAMMVMVGPRLSHAGGENQGEQDRGSRLHVGHRNSPAEGLEG